MNPCETSSEDQLSFNAGHTTIVSELVNSSAIAIERESVLPSLDMLIKKDYTARYLQFLGTMV